MSDVQKPSLNHKIRVLIIGCGIGGLACAIGIRKAGHEVTILDRMPEVQEIGAGINISPNATRALRSLGVLSNILPHANIPHSANLRSYTSALLSTQRLGPLISELYDTPYTVIHRADLHAVLYAEAIRLGTSIFLSHPVTSLDLAAPSATVTNGNVFTADLIIGADGEKSICRDVLLGAPSISRDSGDHVFRITVPTERLSAHPQLAFLVDPPCINLVVGPGAHATTYALNRDGLFNVVLTVAHEGMEEPPMLPRRVDIEEAKKAFAGWDERLQVLLGMAQGCSRWTLLDTQMPQKWVEGRTLLIGDAAHAMLPFLGQGAAMALEDAVVLSTLLAHLSDLPPSVKDPRTLLPHLLNTYCTLRTPRVRFVKSKTRAMRDLYTYADGPEQQARDSKLRAEMVAVEMGEVDEAGRWTTKGKELKGDFAKDSANFLVDVALRDMLFGYDAVKEAEKGWERLRKEMVWGKLEGREGKREEGH